MLEQHRHDGGLFPRLLEAIRTATDTFSQGSGRMTGKPELTLRKLPVLPQM